LITEQEQEQKLNEIASELFDYADEIKIIKDLFDAFPVRHDIASPYLNFRDALFHFKKMCNAFNDKNEYGFIQQCSCVEEHLNRGLKDFAIHICNNYYIRIIHKILNFKKEKGNKDIISKLRKIYHNMKNLVVEIRHTGQTLQHFDNRKNLWLSKMVNIIQAFNNLKREHPSLEQLYNQFSRETI